jgi:hypothetical protein
MKFQFTRVRPDDGFGRREGWLGEVRPACRDEMQRRHSGFGLQQNISIFWIVLGPAVSGSPTGHGGARKAAEGAVNAGSEE